MHSAGDVAFVVEVVGDDGHSAARDDLAGEHDATTQFAEGVAANIVTEINFWEVGVSGNGKAEQSHVFKLEADDADIRLAIVVVGFGAARRETCDEVSGDGKVQEDEISPFGG